MMFQFLRSFRRLPSGPATMIVALGAVAVTATAAFSQGADRTVWQGVYTDEQAERGKATYAQQCASCHGATLAGGDSAPALTGGTFLNNWNGTSAADLFNRIHDTMPVNDPGSLSGAQVADITAHIFKTNGFPAGQAALAPSPAALGTMKIVATKPAG